MDTTASPPSPSRARRRKPIWIGLGLTALVAVVVGLALFQPWKLFTNVEVNEATPFSGNTTVSSGTFTSLAHPTSGTAKIGTTADGTTVVFFENLNTDNGPDLKVYLSPAEPSTGSAAGGVNLGALKGNQGNQSYAVPAGTDLARYQSVVIWCERFAVAFGAAPLTDA